MRISDWSSDVCSSDLRHFGGVDGEEAAMAPILPAPDEEGLDAHRTAPGREREDVRIAQPFGIDRLAALDEGQRLQPVSQHRSEERRVGKECVSTCRARWSP